MDKVQLRQCQIAPKSSNSDCTLRRIHRLIRAASAASCRYHPYVSPRCAVRAILSALWLESGHLHHLVLRASRTSTDRLSGFHQWRTSCLPIETLPPAVDYPRCSFRILEELGRLRTAASEPYGLQYPPAPNTPFGDGSASCEVAIDI